MKLFVGKEARQPMVLGALCGVVFVLTDASSTVVYTVTMIVATVSCLAYYGYFDRFLPPRWRRR